jgi:hypothetical protein
MKIFFILLVIVGVLFFFKKKIVEFIIKYRKTKGIKRPKVDAGLVYVPNISSRVFTFAIEITEVGGGKATIAVVKLKE